MLLVDDKMPFVEKCPLELALVEISYTAVDINGAETIQVFVI